MRLNALGRLTMNNPARAQLLLRYVAAKLAALDPMPAGRTLVVGCGQGMDIDIALGRFGATEVVAIDVDPRQVDRARRRVRGRRGVTIEIGDVVELGSEDQSFDTVFDLGAIHLVPDWRRAYGEVARVLKPGGKFRFETIVGRHFRALLPVSTAGFRSPNDTGYGESAVLERLSEVGLEADATSVLRPRAMFLTGLVGDLIGVATKRRRPREAAPPPG